MPVIAYCLLVFFHMTSYLQPLYEGQWLYMCCHFMLAPDVHVNGIYRFLAIFFEVIVLCDPMLHQS